MSADWHWDFWHWDQERPGDFPPDPAQEKLPFLQTRLWAEFRRSLGWSVLQVAGRGPKSGILHALVLIRPLPAGFCLAYCPHGPVRLDREPQVSEELYDRPAEDESQVLEFLSRALGPQLPSSCLFVRWDLPWGQFRSLDSEYSGYPRLPAPFLPAPLSVQAPDTLLLTLDDSLESTLAAMHKKTRYNIRLAEKKGVQVRVATREDLPAWYRILETTARRDGIGLHGLDYYRRLFDLLDPARSAGPVSPAGQAGTTGPSGDGPRLQVFLAEFEGQLLAGIWVLVNGGRATYLYGASSNEMRELMPSYALQWAALNWAHQAGCRTYDFYGLSPQDDPRHPMGGLWRFKTGFGGRLLHRPGAWDYALRPLLYRVFRFLEILRRGKNRGQR